MDHTSIHSLRVPVLIAGLLGFCASVACGSEAPEEKTGGGLGSAGGKAGSGTGAVVGKGGGISVTGGHQRERRLRGCGRLERQHRHGGNG